MYFQSKLRDISPFIKMEAVPPMSGSVTCGIGVSATYVVDSVKSLLRASFAHRALFGRWWGRSASGLSLCTCLTLSLGGSVTAVTKFHLPGADSCVHVSSPNLPPHLQAQQLPLGVISASPRRIPTPDLSHQTRQRSDQSDPPTL